MSYLGIHSSSPLIHPSTQCLLITYYVPCPALCLVAQGSNKMEFVPGLWTESFGRRQSTSKLVSYNLLHCSEYSVILHVSLCWHYGLSIRRHRGFTTWIYYDSSFTGKAAKRLGDLLKIAWRVRLHDGARVLPRVRMGPKLRVLCRCFGDSQVPALLFLLIKFSGSWVFWLSKDIWTFVRHDEVCEGSII